ncbi:MAG: hypothetical protein FWG93_05430 [Oscillospiraceae bacterium]|nr:hypothetical protein [Oscillospiraceae bacterium]
MKKRFVSLLLAVLFVLAAHSVIAADHEAMTAESPQAGGTFDRQIDPSRIYFPDHEHDGSCVHGAGDFVLLSYEPVDYTFDRIDPSRIYSFDHEHDGSCVHGAGDFVLLPPGFDLAAAEAGEKA